MARSLLRAGRDAVTALGRTVIAATLVLAAHPAVGQVEPLRIALELYWNGEYARTLDSLGEATLDALDPGDRVEAHKYRALSLVALDRPEDARGELAALLDLDPGHALDPSLVPPKVLAQFDQARREHAGERFDEAKRRYDDGDFQGALSILDRVLRMQPGLTMALEYRQLAQAQLDLVARAAELAPEATPEPAPEEPVDRVYNISGDVSEPTPLRQGPPVYPDIDLRRRIGGVVVLTIVVDRDGSVREARVLRSVNRRLDEAALGAVRRWRFRPAIRAGRPVAVYKIIQIRFEP